MDEMKKMKLGTQHRSLPFTAESQRTAEDGSPVVRIAISSEYSVTREFGTEVLDHTAGSVDLSRLKNGAAFLVNHDQGDQVGVLENVSLDADRVLRADVRFSRSQRGQDILHDILDGIRKHISVGYQIRKMKLERKSDGPDTYRVVEWMPFEASTVAVPADPTVGVGRSAEFDNANDVEIICEDSDERGLTVTTEHTTVSTSAEVMTLDDSGRLEKSEYHSTTESHVVTSFEETAPEDAEANATVLVAEADTARTEATTEEIPVVTDVHERSINAVINSMESTRMEHINVTDPIVLSDKEQKQYSIANAIESALNGQRSGLEFEVSDEIAKKLGREANGFYVPTSLRVMTAGTATAGAELVYSQEGDFIDALRAQAVVTQLGAKVVPASQKVAYPRTNSTASAQWVAEDSAATSADFVFESVMLDPKNLIATTGFSRKLLSLSSFAVEDLVRSAFNKDFANALDKAAFAGAGAPAPTGILNATGVHNLTAASSGSFMTYAMLINAETAIVEANASGDIAYVLTPQLAGYAKRTLRDPGVSGYIMQDGQINGRKAVVSTNLPWTTTVSHAAVAGDFSNLALADGGAIEVIIDKVTQANKGNVIITGQWLADVVILQPKAFAKLTQMKTA